MSQSDYIKYKRVQTVLNIDNTTANQPPVFGEQVYLDNKEFTLENTVTNLKPTYNRLVLRPISNPPQFQSVLNMDKPVNCATYQAFQISCTNPVYRTNRVPMSSVFSNPVPPPLTIDQVNQQADIKNECICKSKNNKTTYFGIVR